MTELKDLNLGDFSLDDLDDLPSFTCFPTGAFHVVLEAGIEQKLVAAHPSFEVVMTLKQALEITDSDTTLPAPKPGDKCSTLFMMDNEMGRGKFKAFAAPIAAMISNTSSKAILEHSKGMELVVVGKRVASKDDKEKFYFNITTVAVP